VWYKVIARDEQNRPRFYPTSSIMRGFIVEDIKKHGPFLATVTLYNKSQFSKAHFSMSKQLKSYDFIRPVAPNTDS
jgi:hypothetical protein